MTRTLRLLTAAALLLALLATPISSAAPTVANSSTSAVAVNAATDYVTFENRGVPVNSAGTCLNNGIRLTITSPDGTTMQFVGNPIFTQEDCTTVTYDFFTYSLDGTLLSGPAGQVTATGNLNGHPADGSWIFDDNSRKDTVIVVLHTGSKTVNVFGNTGTVFHQTYGDNNHFWNYRLSASTYTTTYYCCLSSGPPPFPAEEDPNNAYFFSDTTPPTVTPWHTTTLETSTTPSNCNTFATIIESQAWGGATSGQTVFTSYIYRDGDFTAENTVSGDLRNIPGAITTTDENEGAVVAGTDTETLPYNNVAGTSFQARATTTADGETLGAIVWVPSGLCTLTAPGAIAALHAENLELTASQAQCDDDLVSFTLYPEQNGIIGLAWTMYVYAITPGNPNTQTLILTVPKAQWATADNYVYGFTEVFNTGPYYAKVLYPDTLGVLTLADARTFNVPRGNCIDTEGDDSPLFFAIQNLNETVLSHEGNESTRFEHLDWGEHYIMGQNNLTQWENRYVMNQNNFTRYDVIFNIAQENATQALITNKAGIILSVLNASQAAQTSTILARMNVIESYLAGQNNATQAQIAAFRANMTQYLDHIDWTLHGIYGDINATRGDILDALNNLNITISGNFTISNETLNAIYNNTQTLVNGTILVNNMGFDGLQFDGWAMIWLWLAAMTWCLTRSKLFAALGALIGILCVLIPGPEYIGWVGVLVFTIALWLEAVAREKLPYHWFNGTIFQPKRN